MVGFYPPQFQLPLRNDVEKVDCPQGLLLLGGTSSTNRCRLSYCSLVDLNDVIIIVIILIVITTGFGESILIIRSLLAVFVFTLFFIRIDIDGCIGVDSYLPLSRCRLSNL